MTLQDLVSVIIPAYNAQATIAETLVSACGQTHRNLEIIVIDDGSTDETVAIIQGFAAQDARIRWFSVPNGGVATARNAGIAAAAGAYIAPLDADDLWHPRKIELQLQLFHTGPATLGLVYNWYRPIDALSRINGIAAKPTVEGWVLHRHLDWNFVSNGSTPLIRTAALCEVRYDPALHAASNQGCEDYLIQLQIALRWQFACVPAFLTGYRKVAGAMSSNVARMLRSHIQMYQIMQPELPDSAQRVAERKIAQHQVELCRNRLRRKQFSEAARALSHALRSDPSATSTKIIEQLGFAARLAARSATPQDDLATQSFTAVDPLRSGDQWKPRRRLERLERLARLDAEWEARRDLLG